MNYIQFFSVDIIRHKIYNVINNKMGNYPVRVKKKKCKKSIDF